MKKLFFISFLISFIPAHAQDLSNQLQLAFQAFEKDSQLSSAISSLYVEEAANGNVVFEKNSRVGLAPASTQKIITTASAYELLGSDYKFVTTFYYTGKIEKEVLKGNIYVVASGDPSLGSWRWPQTNEASIISKLVAALVEKKIKKIDGAFMFDKTSWGNETIPDGWIWQDIGNYYGAGASVFNWRENQFDIIMKSGKILGDSVSILRTEPANLFVIKSFLHAAAKGTGDNAYVYYPLHTNDIIVRGSIPVEENNFKISASIPQPGLAFTRMPEAALAKQKIGFNSSRFYATSNQHFDSVDLHLLYQHYSPSLDSLIYWFNKRSINLYGEALAKSIGYTVSQNGSTPAGIAALKNYWKQKDLSSAEINMVDGSGLSPLNRVTTHAQVSILQYARKQKWFNAFYNALPEFNNMKVKSGTINGAKGFCGYHKAKNGKEYVFSFLVNNYNGSAAMLVQKMYRIMDLLK